MFWSRNKELGSKEFEELKKDIISIRSDIAIIKAQVEAMDTNMTSLRGLINRKGKKVMQDIDENEGLTPEQQQQLAALFGTPSQQYEASQSLLSKYASQQHGINESD